jgi:hypothetical protein
VVHCTGNGGLWHVVLEQGGGADDAGCIPYLQIVSGGLLMPVAHAQVMETVPPELAESETGEALEDQRRSKRRYPRRRGHGA